MRMRSIGSHRWNDTMVVDGEEFDATDKEARLLAAIGRAVPIDVAAVTADETPIKRIRKRRDMRPDRSHTYETK